MLPLKQGSYWNKCSKRQYWNILYCLVFHCENSVFLHTWVPVAKMLPTQQDWLLNKSFQPAVCLVCLLLQSVTCWVWRLEEGQEPDNSTFMCASSSDSEEVCMGLPCARRWADVMEGPDRSLWQSPVLCDRWWEGCGDTQQRFVCAEHPGQCCFCLLLWLTEYLYNPWQCRMRGQYRGITAVPGHKAIIKLKKNNCVQWTKEGLRASLFQNQPGLGH